VVAITQVLASSCQTAASSPVSVPTKKLLEGHDLRSIHEHPLENGRCDLAPAAATARETCQSDLRRVHQYDL